MKLMIASDIHGSSYYCEKLMERYEEERPEKILLLGDILYQNFIGAVPAGGLVDGKGDQVFRWCIEGAAGKVIDIDRIALFVGKENF